MFRKPLKNISPVHHLALGILNGEFFLVFSASLLLVGKPLLTEKYIKLEQNLLEKIEVAELIKNRA